MATPSLVAANAASSARVTSPPTAQQKSKWLGGVLVLAATAGLALKGIWARLAYEEGLSVGGVLFYRSAISVPLLIAGYFWLMRSSAGDSQPTSYSRRDWVQGALLGAMFSVGMYSDFESIAKLGASVSRVLLFGFPLVVLVLDSAVRRQLPEARRLGGFFVAWLGLAAVAMHGASLPHVYGEQSEFRLLWGLASMVFYALYVWLSGGVSRRLGSFRLTAVSNVTTATVVIGVMLWQAQGVSPAASVSALGWVGIMVVISTVVPYFMLMEGIRRLGSAEASLLAMTGPLVTVAAGWVLLGEAMSRVQLLGVVAVLGGVAMAQKRSGA